MKWKLQTFVIILCNLKHYLCNYTVFGFVKSATDLKYILKYGSSGWLSGHLRAGEIGNASRGGAVRHRYTAISF